jgi:hypothetical protein
MTTIRSTLISHIFNEEYLLPFWLNHHKNMFDDIIIIDYNSRDKSIEICKSICPDCIIIKTRNNCFDATEVDKEVMDIENSLQGIKVVLNTTEFLFCEKPVKDFFINNTNPISYAINAISPYSINLYRINNIYELFNNLFNDDVVYHYDRIGSRFIHNFSNGNYTIGRHSSNNISIPTNEMFIVWFGFYPMNNDLLKRKLQIQQNIPQSDKDRGFGFQHLWDRDKLLNINLEKANSGLALKNINNSLFNLLDKYLKNITI